MPERTYMGVDRRRDHSLRIPRPDLTVRIGTPNACASCHADKPAAWAAAAVERWHGPVDGARHYGEIFHAARGGDAAAGPELAALAKDVARPAIVRATALAELARFPGPQLESAVAAGAGDPEPLVRYAAALALEGLPADLRVRAAGVLLDDPVLGVRAEAARWLAGASPDLMTAAQASALARAVDDFRATLAVNADRPEAQLNRGNLEQALGRNAEAESAYRVATELDPELRAGLGQPRGRHPRAGRRGRRRRHPARGAAPPARRRRAASRVRPGAGPERRSLRGARRTRARRPAGAGLRALCVRVRRGAELRRGNDAGARTRSPPPAGAIRRTGTSCSRSRRSTGMPDASLRRGTYAERLVAGDPDEPRRPRYCRNWVRAERARGKAHDCQHTP